MDPHNDFDKHDDPDGVRTALEDLNLHCTDHAPDPDCEGCRVQLQGMRFVDLEGPAGGARTAAETTAPECDARTVQSTGTDSLGLSIDMLDADRLRQFAQNLLTYGPDITHWANVPHVVSKLQTIATGIEKAVRDIGTLRALSTPPASPAATSSPDDRIFAVCPECQWRTAEGRAEQHASRCSRPETPRLFVDAEGNQVPDPASPRVSAATPAPIVNRLNRAMVKGAYPEAQAYNDGLRTAVDIVEDELKPSAAERPAQTCATCRFLGLPTVDEPKAWWCRKPESPLWRKHWKQEHSAQMGCVFHEPAPPGPVAQEKDK